MKNTNINYKQIYKDILAEKFPTKSTEILPLLEKKQLTTIDIIAINDKIFGKNSPNMRVNQKYRCYKEQDIIKILDYQKANNLNNTQLALHFKLSRNTIIKWKKLNL